MIEPARTTAEAIRDLSYYTKYLNILTKESTLVPLRFNSYQEKMWQIVKAQRYKKPVRIIVLKARQIGISTWSTALTYHICATNKYKRAVIIAHDQDATANLFGMCNRYYNYSPEFVQPMKRYSNKKELVFENPLLGDNKAKADDVAYKGLLSSISVETANKETAGRSGTINTLHMSECAFWKKGGKVITGLLQAVPRQIGTTVIMESTANGMAGEGEEFYIRWKMAEAGESDYTPVFFPWWENPEYEMWDESFVCNKEEEDIKRRFPLITDTKLAWRRWKIRNEMGNALMDPVSQFKQEYPASAEEAFIASGRTVFDSELILDLLDMAKAKALKGEEKCYEL